LTVQRFISLQQPGWLRLRQFLQEQRVAQDKLREYLLVYRQTVADLAYLRAHSPDHPILRELEGLVVRAQASFYRPPGEGGLTSILSFFFREFPCTVVESWRPISWCLLLFSVSALLGFLLSLNDIEFAYSILPSTMTEALGRHDLWTGHEAVPDAMTSCFLGTHNIQVSLLAFALGITVVGTLFIVLLNGVYFGAAMYAAVHFDMFYDLLSFVMPHGVIEIPELFLASGAGLIIGRALLFPRPYSRSDALRYHGQRALRLFMGSLPILMAAALIEANFSPTRADWEARQLVAGLAFSGFLLYTLGYPFYNWLRCLMSRYVWTARRLKS
jgi:uncharacterized membrane protein SpoIIM required for sporulation